MNIVFNNDMERIYLSSEYLYLKENEANNIEFKIFEDFCNSFNKNRFVVSSNVEDELKIKFKQNAEKIYNVFIDGKNKVN